MISMIFNSIKEILGELTDSLSPIANEFFNFDSGNPHDYNAGFLDEDQLLKKKNKGFCLTGKTSLSVKLSYRNSIIIGGTGTGKSATVLIPTILSMQSSMIINDPSGELFKLTSGFKSRTGFTVKVLNYSQPEHSVGYNPIERANTMSEIAKVASTLIRASVGDGA